MEEPYAIEKADTSWMDQASCRGLDPNLFFPERGEVVSQRQALSICNGTQVKVLSGRKKGIVVGEEACPVKEQCLQYALSLPAHQDTCGVWGGVSHKTRMLMRRQKPVVLDFVPCGTVRAYRRHLRAKETPCDRCREANTADKNIRNMRKRLENQT
jgi:WhiB family redox-sensing transcriptional regulator